MKRLDGGGIVCNLFGVMTPSKKPVLAYLHRYPPEIEVLQWPAFRRLAELAGEEFELVYLCMGPAGGCRNEELRRQMRVIELPVTVDQSDGRDKLRKTFAWYWHLGRTLRRLRTLEPAAVICKEILPFIPGRVARTGIPTLITVCDWWWTIYLGHSSLGRRLAAWLERLEVRGWNRPATWVAVNTQTERELVMAKGMDGDRICVIDAPLNAGLFQPLEPAPTKAELGLEPELRHFAVFGIIRQGKGYEQLLDWWRAAAKKHPDWRLVIIGGAGGEDWCRGEIAKRGLEAATRMTGWLSAKEDVNRWLNAMDAVIVFRRNSPENRGAIPSALSNGLSTGRPVVATGLPGIAEVVRDGEHGFLFEPDQEDSFIDALERALADTERAAQVGRAGRLRAAGRFDSDRVAREHLDLIREMISG
jgi:glycosyltransferase involved in cell wall biosynthesis